MEENIKDSLRDMFTAQDNYGCGFYNQEDWAKAYNGLREIMGIEQDDD